VRHSRVESNGIWMHVAEQGDRDGPAVLLIHGFPELWFSWRHQMSGLARNGYRAIAPDMRGYGDTDAPSDPQSYTVFHLVGDLIGLLDHLQVAKVNISFWFSLSRTLVSNLYGMNVIFICGYIFITFLALFA